MTKKYLFLWVFTAICYTINAQTYTKGTASTELFTISKDSVATVLEWFNLIEKKGIVLSYNSTNINLYEKVQLRRKTYSIDKLLNSILDKYEFDTSFIDQKILLQIKSPKNIQISGFICDKSTKEPLEGCIVKFETKSNRSFYVITDSKGIFHKTLPYENFQLKASCIGYEPYTRNLLNDKVQSINIEMA